MARARNSAFSRCKPLHHTGGVVDHVLVGAGEFTQRGVVRASVVDGAQAAASEQMGELIGIDLVALVAEPVLLASIADDEVVDLRQEEVVQPLRLGALLEGHADRAAHSAEELQERMLFRGKDSPSDHPSVLLPNRRHRG
jgi:hypothetical protein